MAGDGRDKNADRQAESGAGGLDGLLRDARSGLESYISGQKAHAEYLKDGGTSGITGEFLKPEFTDSASGSKTATIAGSPADDASPLFANAPGYAGEAIYREVLPDVVACEGGDDLYVIARQHLGDDASEEEVEKHAAEIARVNGLDDPTFLLDKGVLELPGHTADGGFVREDHLSNTRTVWPDGSVVTENFIDGIRQERRPADNGGYQEETFGPAGECRYRLRRSGDGYYELENFEGDDRLPDAVETERERLLQLADSRIANEQDRERFRQDTEKLQARMGELEERYRREWLDKTMHADEAARRAREQAACEIIATYRETARVMESDAAGPLAESDRIIVAQQIMHHAADPTTIDQGQHNTCPAATLEARLYTRQPADAARLVADLAISGSHNTRGYAGEDAVSIHLDSNSLKPDCEAEKHPPDPQARSFASQLFQVAAFNIAWERVNIRDGRQVRYEQHRDETQLLDYSKDPPVEPTGNVNVTNEDIVYVTNQVTGRREEPFVIQRKGVVVDRVQEVDSAEELKSRLITMKERGQLPAIVYVHSGNEPFLSDSGGGAAGGSGSWHVVTVTDYDESTGKIAVDNQWGEAADRVRTGQLTPEELYRATASPA